MNNKQNHIKMDNRIEKCNTSNPLNSTKKKQRTFYLLSLSYCIQNKNNDKCFIPYTNNQINFYELQHLNHTNHTRKLFIQSIDFYYYFLFFHVHEYFQYNKSRYNLCNILCLQSLSESITKIIRCTTNLCCCGFCAKLYVSIKHFYEKSIEKK